MHRFGKVKPSAQRSPRNAKSALLRTQSPWAMSRVVPSPACQRVRVPQALRTSEDILSISGRTKPAGAFPAPDGEPRNRIFRGLRHQLSHQIPKPGAGGTASTKEI